MRIPYNIFRRKKPNKKQSRKIRCYVDGSYSPITKQYGYSAIFVDRQNKIVKEIAGSDRKYNESKNIAGELTAVIKAIQYAVKKHYKIIKIYYDYTGIRTYAYHNLSKSTIGKNYYSFMNMIRKENKIKISFTKVKAHSNNFFNDKADKLAKKQIYVFTNTQKQGKIKA